MKHMTCLTVHEMANRINEIFLESIQSLQSFDEFEDDVNFGCNENTEYILVQVTEEDVFRVLKSL